MMQLSFMLLLELWEVVESMSGKTNWSRKSQLYGEFKTKKSWKQKTLLPFQYNFYFPRV